jgi:argininosuccinate lyase
MAAVLPPALQKDFTKAQPEQGTAVAFIDEAVYDALKLENVVGRRQVYGGTSPDQVLAAVERAKTWLQNK